MIEDHDIDEIDALTTGYRPAPEALSLLADTHMVLLCGIAGAGKDAVQTRLLEAGDMYQIVTTTTRAPRENNGVMEQHGREYYFRTLDEAKQMIRDKRYFEVAKVHGRINGVSVDEIQRIHDAGKTAVGDIDYQGVEYFHGLAPSVQAIFLVPPSYQTWIDRLSRRYASDDEFRAELPARVESAIRELEWVLRTPYVQVVVNDDLEATVAIVRRVIDGEPAPAGGRADVEQLLAALRAS